MQALMCKKCGAVKGRHQVFSYHCPTESGFSRVERFELEVCKLSMSVDDVRKLQGRDLEFVEQEIARRVLKNVEAALGTFELKGTTLDRREVIDALTMVKKGYGL
jgi:hypothetical protein